jgi:cell division septal protein FtsQ
MHFFRYYICVMLAISFLFYVLFLFVQYISSFAKTSTFNMYGNQGMI